jgi:diguanylate cyclase (GGDEF)-like protein
MTPAWHRRHAWLVPWIGPWLILMIGLVACVGLRNLPPPALSGFPGGPAGAIAAGTFAAWFGVVILMRLLAARDLAMQAQRHDLAATRDALETAAEQSRASISRLESALTCVQEGLLLIDAQGGVSVCNDRAIELLGVPPDLMGAQRPLTDLPRDQPGVYEREGADGRILQIRTAPLVGGGMVQTFTDITERRAAEDRLRQLILQDELTGLANRRLLLRNLQQALDLSARSRRGIAVLHLALDTTSRGQAARDKAHQDKLLKAIAQRLGTQARVSDTVSRIGGGEFAILATLVDDPAGAATMAQRLVAAMSGPYLIDGETSVAGVSVGIALYPTDAVSSDTLMRCAETALNAARDEGRGSVRFYDTKLAAD